MGKTIKTEREERRKFAMMWEWGGDRISEQAGRERASHANQG